MQGALLCKSSRKVSKGIICHTSRFYFGNLFLSKGHTNTRFVHAVSLFGLVFYSLFRWFGNLLLIIGCTLFVKWCYFTICGLIATERYYSLISVLLDQHLSVLFGLSLICVRLYQLQSSLQELIRCWYISILFCSCAISLYFDGWVR